MAILGYYEDGPNLVTLAMNGWSDAEPAWWLNLEAHPDARVDLKDGARRTRARRRWPGTRPAMGNGAYVLRLRGCRRPRHTSVG